MNSQPKAHEPSRLSSLAREVRQHYYDMDEETRNKLLAGHWWDHVVRVSNNAWLILTRYESTPRQELVMAAAFCHDLVQPDGDNNDRAAALLSGAMCEAFMADAHYSQEEQKLAASLILAADRDVKRAESREERILYVADKLDLMGIDGVVRLLIEIGCQGITVRHDLANAARQRIGDWSRYMLSLSTGSTLVRERLAEAGRILDRLQEPTELWK